MRGISIVVCFHNSERTISNCLDSIMNQNTKNDDIKSELILVDNNSKDNSRKIAENKLSDDWPIPIQILTEEKQGLMNARQKGVLNAKYQYILFVDDDNYIKADYILNASKILKSNKNIGVLAGESKLAKESKLNNSHLFTKNSKLFAVGSQAKTDGFVKVSHFWGAGLMLERSLIKSFYEKKYNFRNTGRDRKSVV